MPHRIPVFLVIVDPELIPPVLSGWNDASNLISDMYEEPGAVYMSVSANWWHLILVHELSKAIEFNSLDFLESEVAVLNSKQIVSAIEGVDRLSQMIEQGLPGISLLSLSDGALLASYDYSSIFKEAQPISDVPEADDGEPAIMSFCQFIKSLDEALVKARSNGGACKTI